MAKTKGIFKTEKREDTIIPLVEEMKILYDGLECEKTYKVLDKIKEELQKPALDTWPYSYVPLGDIQTIKDVYDLLISTPIRLDHRNYNFHDFLNLIIAVCNRKDELKGLKRADIDRQQKVVAEEMIRLGIFIPYKKDRSYMTPNRRLLNIIYDINPDMCAKEYAKKERVYKSIVVEDKEDLVNIRNDIGKYSDRERIYGPK